MKKIITLLVTLSFALSGTAALAQGLLTPTLPLQPVGTLQNNTLTLHQNSGVDDPAVANGMFSPHLKGKFILFDPASNSSEVGYKFLLQVQSIQCAPHNSFILNTVEKFKITPLGKKIKVTSSQPFAFKRLKVEGGKLYKCDDNNLLLNAPIHGYGPPQ